jgi:hypothetical protein
MELFVNVITMHIQLKLDTTSFVLANGENLAIAPTLVGKDAVF